MSTSSTSCSRAAHHRSSGRPVGPDAYATAICEGGYPEARTRPAGRLRNRWFRDYLAGTLGKDLLELADLRRTDEADRLLRLLASQSANLLSYRKIAQQLEFDDKTVKEHILLLKQLFLVRRLPGWRPGLGAREAARPKAYVCDPGLLAHLLGADEARIRTDDQVKGKACETLVLAELLKHASCRADCYACSTTNATAKTSTSSSRTTPATSPPSRSKPPPRSTRRDRRWLERLRDARPDRFKAGIIVHSGAQTTPLGDRLWASPSAASGPDRTAIAPPARRPSATKRPTRPSVGHNTMETNAESGKSGPRAIRGTTRIPCKLLGFRREHRTTENRGVPVRVRVSPSALYRRLGRHAPSASAAPANSRRATIQFNVAAGQGGRCARGPGDRGRPVFDRVGAEPRRATRHRRRRSRESRDNPDGSSQQARAAVDPLIEICRTQMRCTTVGQCASDSHSGRAGV